MKAKARRGATKAPARKAAAAVGTEAPEVAAEALADRAGRLWRALHAKLETRDPELARELRAVLRAHMAVMVALFVDEVAQLRRDIG